jgi:hypothetical protein
MTDSAKHQLAGLAALDRIIEIAMRALVESYPVFRREPRLIESAEARSAAALVDLCARILDAIDRHRRLVARQLPEEDQNWPF